MDCEITLVLAYVSQDSLEYVKSCLELDELDMDTSTMTWYCYLNLSTENNYQVAYAFLESNPDIAKNSWLAIVNKSKVNVKAQLPKEVSKIINELGISVKQSVID